MVFSRSKSDADSKSVDTKQKISFRAKASMLFGMAKTEQKTEQKHVKKVVTVDSDICSQIVVSDEASKIKSNKKILQRQNTGGAALKQNVGTMDDQEIKNTFQRVKSSPDLGAKQQSSPNLVAKQSRRQSLTLPNGISIKSPISKSSLKKQNSNRSCLSVNFTSIICDIVEIESLVTQTQEHKKQEALEAAKKKAEATKRRTEALKALDLQK